MWSAINSAVTGCFDLLLWPFAWAPVWLQLAVMALPAGIATLLAVRFCSSQTGRDAAKSKIVAYLLELWIYRDDLKVSLLAQARRWRSPTSSPSWRRWSSRSRSLR